MDRRTKSPRRVRLNTMQIVALGFFGVIFLGGVLLWLPVCNRQPIAFIDALFTSVTSVCVTGLVTVVPAEQFTLAPADPDRRTRSDRVYGFVFPDPGETDIHERKDPDPGGVRTGHTLRPCKVYHPHPARDIHRGRDRSSTLFCSVCP